MNDGNGGNQMFEIDSAAVRDKPWLVQHTTTAPSILGATYVF